MNPLLLPLIGYAVFRLASLVRKPAPPAPSTDGQPPQAGKLPRGVRNNNFGNIRINPANNWRGRIPLDQNSDGAFEQFISPEHGTRALMIILRTYIQKRKLNTVRKIIQRFAPASENDTEAYIVRVSSETGIPPSRFIGWNEGTIKNLASAISRVENGELLPLPVDFYIWKLVKVKPPFYIFNFHRSVRL